ncbi:hypothetical protein BB559_006919 [Furculomyces boomerangus]|uniref:Protein arginine methyltransferase NDUFAF7 n=1 Tax=Furculomyces boomerangus TaxID=61424 RepID=A0A2T9XZS9_9FUNG|nr:hypothetical protein BB559_006919 [Furculomyces boomerangus]
MFRSISGRSQNYLLPKLKNYEPLLFTFSVNKTQFQKPKFFSQLNDIQSSQNDSLSRHIKQKILATGPITISEYIKMALTSPLGGYYTKTDIFGHSGDFVTSPEISQMFGEVIALWYIMQWEAKNYPKNIEFIELGPGKGTLIEDILRASKRFPKFIESIKCIHLIETSPTLRNQQAIKLADVNSPEFMAQKFDKKCLDTIQTCPSKYPNIDIKWYADIESLSLKNSDSVAMIMAHEFFDALPIHRFELGEFGWSEILVDIAENDKPTNIIANTKTLDSVKNSEYKDATLQNPNVEWYRSPTQSKSIGSENKTPDLVNVDDQFETSENLEFKFVKTKKPTINSTAYLNLDKFKSVFEKGDSIEISPQSAVISQKLAKLVNETNGVALIVDYGKDYTQSSTFRGVSKHKFVNPLLRPGTIDLTADVDFSYLKESINPIANTFGPVEQQHFLHQMGIQARLQQLLKIAKTTDVQKDLIASYQRLTDPAAMGKIYKFLAIKPKNDTNPPVSFDLPEKVPQKVTKYTSQSIKKD